MGATTPATTIRVLRQLGRDRRTLALLLGVPSVLLILVRHAFDSRPEVFQRVGLPLIGVFPLVSMFLVASIAMLRERRSGTLERLMALPTTRLGLLVGYAGSFALVACVQTAIVMVVGVAALGLDITGPLWLAVVVAVANALLGMALGLFLSAFRPHRVPGHPVHAGVPPAAVPAVRTPGAARGDGPTPRAHLRCPPAHLRPRRAPGGRRSARGLRRRPWSTSS